MIASNESSMGYSMICAARPGMGGRGILDKSEEVTQRVPGGLPAGSIRPVSAEGYPHPGG